MEKEVKKSTLVEDQKKEAVQESLSKKKLEDQTIIERHTFELPDKGKQFAVLDAFSELDARAKTQIARIQKLEEAMAYLVEIFEGMDKNKDRAIIVPDEIEKAHILKK